MYDNNDDFIPLQMPANDETSESPVFTNSVEDTSISQPSLPAMRNVKDLVNTLARMNKKLVEMEIENAELRQELGKKADKRDVIQMISKVETIGVPKNGLFSNSFIVRGLSIYGHWFVINLVISIIMSIIGFILFATVFNQIATNLMNAGF